MLLIEHLKKGCNLKVSVVVEWIQLYDSTEELESLALVDGLFGLSRLYLGQQAQCFVAVLVLRAGKHAVEVLLCGLEVAVMELHLGKAEKGLVVLGVVLETFFIMLERLVEVA